MERDDSGSQEHPHIHDIEIGVDVEVRKPVSHGMSDAAFLGIEVDTIDGAQVLRGQE